MPAQENYFRRLVRFSILASGLTGLSALSGQTAGIDPQPKPLNPAFFGVWKENAAQASEPEHTVKFERKADGIHMGTDPHAFLYDGVDRPSAGVHFHITTAWRKTGARSYESLMKTNGKLIGTTTRAISAEGSTMTVTYLSAENGSRTTTKWMRVGSTTDPDPLAGTWRLDPTSRITETPARLIIERKGDTISLSDGIPGQATAEFAARPDGRDYPWKNAKASGVVAVSLRQLDDKAFVESVKLAGAPFATKKFVLSADGKTLIRILTMTLAGKNPQTSVSVFERER